VTGEDPGSAPAGPTRRALHLHAVPAISEQASAVRAAVLRWARTVCRSREVVNDVGLAVYEALANVIEHAYPPIPRIRCSTCTRSASKTC
jgi:serine/threonine-protein kinase RsbW